MKERYRSDFIVLRWGIETVNGKQKNQQQIELFNGHKLISIQQLKILFDNLNHYSQIKIKIRLFNRVFNELSSIKEISCPKIDLLKKYLLLPIVYLVLQNKITIFRYKPFLSLLFYRPTMNLIINK